MGVRLYPNTTDRSSLEKLAKVPAGTFDRLDVMKRRHDVIEALYPRDQEVGYANWRERNGDPHVGTLVAFLLFGWGKFSPVMGIGTGYAGEELDADRIRWLFLQNGIPVKHVALTEGVHWS